MTSEIGSKKFPGVGAVETGPGGLPVLSIKTPAAEARIFLLGAQLSNWRPRGFDEVLFMSAKSHFEVGQAIRGGVPVCFPGFGPRPGFPAHGFVRNRSWKLEAVEAMENDAVRAVFVTGSDDVSRVLWPHDFLVRLIFTIGRELSMELEVSNTSEAAFTFSEALHTYFIVGDVRQAAVTGLEGVSYRDFPDRSRLFDQEGSIRFVEETDRVYVNTKATCVLEDPVLKRGIVVAKTGSDTTTVWNPWIAKAAAMPDFGDDEWPGMVCIETANAAENSVTLRPKARHSMGALISVEHR